MEFHAVRVLGRKTKGVSNEAILNHLEDSRQNGVASLLGETWVHPESFSKEPSCQKAMPRNDLSRSIEENVQQVFSATDTVLPA